MTLFSRAEAMLSRTLPAAAGVPVTYQRAGAPPAYLVAVPCGESLPADARQSPPSRVSRAARVYLIAAADLVVGGVRVEPLVGDRIEEPAGRAALAIEVARNPDGTAWEWSDEARTVYRVRCKEV